MITAGDILNGGFRLLVRNPLAVVVWAAIHAVFALVSLWIMLPRMAAMMQTMATLDPEASPQAAQAAMMQNMGGMQGLTWGVSLLGYFVGAVLLCAAFRAALRPGEGGFAFLRIGKDELRMFLMMLIVWIGGVIVAVIFALIVVLVGLLLGLLLRDVHALAILVIFLLAIGAIGAVVYVIVRLTMMFPLTFIRRDLVVDEAWRLTRGRFWTLFLPYLAIMLITSIASSIVMFPLLWSMMSEVFAQAMQSSQAGTPPDPAQVRQAFGAMFGHMGERTSIWAGIIVVSSAINGIALALYAGAMATAARAFLAADGKLPEELLDTDGSGN